MARVRRTKIIRLAGLAAAGATATLTLQGAPAIGASTGAVGTPHALTHARSVVATATAVVGHTRKYVVFNDLSTHDVYLGDPAGKARPRVLVRGARASAVAGDLVEYTAGGAHRWINVGTARGGPVPASWAFLAPDGGVRIRTSGGQTLLDYLHVSGTVRTYRLPAGFPTSGASYTVAGGPAGIAVGVSTAGSPPRMAFSTMAPPATFTELSTAGIEPGARLTCSSLVAGAVGCRTRGSVIRVSTDPSTAPQVSAVAAAPLAVAVTDAYTSWTAPHDPAARSCPCDLISLDPDGAEESIVSGLTSNAITSAGNRFFYSAGGTRSHAGVYVDVFAGGGGRLIAPAPGRALTAGAPAMSGGQVVWIDDSLAGDPVWQVRVGSPAAGAVGNAARVASGGQRAHPAVSGLRTLYQGAHGAIHQVYAGHNTVIGHGALYGVSGNRALVRNTHRHVIVLDLAHRGTTDATRTLGAGRASLWGDYLSYLRRDGSVWRKDLATNDAPVRLASAPGGRPSSTRIVSWGDWTAWTVVTHGRVHSAYRNARSLAAARSLHGRLVAGASVGGVTLGDAGDPGRYAVTAWSSGRRLADVPAGTDSSGRPVGAPVVDAGTVAWLRSGVPTVAALGAAVTNRPRSYGDPLATRHVKRGRTARIAVPTSAPLTRCSVRITRGHFSTTRACVTSVRDRGTVLVHWTPGRSLAPGRYAWSIRAGNRDGALLAATGSARTTCGVISVS